MLLDIVVGLGAGSDVEHPNLDISRLQQFHSLQRLKELVWGENSLPHFLVFIFSFYLVLFDFILISLIFLLRFSLIFS